METEEAKLETWTDSASMYGSKSKSKCQSSWANNTEMNNFKRITHGKQNRTFMF